MNYVTFDIETYSPSELERIDVNEFRSSVIGAYFSWIDEYIAFIEGDEKPFLELLKKADMIVGYNQLWFDLPVLQKYADVELKKLPNYDILVEIEKKIGFKVKLDDVCKATLGSKKTDSYETYKHYYKEKKWSELVDYCMNDVRLTEELFRLVLDGKPLKYNDLLDTKEVILDMPKMQKLQALEEGMESIF
jgi:DEAD/DEAH box helicase domain-containing protein